MGGLDDRLVREEAGGGAFSGGEGTCGSEGLVRSPVSRGHGGSLGSNVIELTGLASSLDTGGVAAVDKGWVTGTALEHNPDTSSVGESSARLPLMVLPTHHVRPASERVVDSVVPSEFPMTTLQQDIAKSLLIHGEFTRIVTSIRVNVFAALTLDFPNQPIRNFLLRGLSRGFALPADVSRRWVTYDNHSTSTTLTATTAEQLRLNCAQEVALGRRSGPFSSAEVLGLPSFANAPIGAVPKGGPDPLTVRFIHDFSFPRGGPLD
ncbi:hypothetical protein HDU67_005823, partial [Dinochytrium kinnereticum]